MGGLPLSHVLTSFLDKKLLIDEPSIIIMDEATAALDVDSEFRLLTLLFERLPKATIFSVGHRPGLQELHSRLLTLQRRPSGGRIVQTKTRDRDAWKRLRGAAVRILRGEPRRAAREQRQEHARTAEGPKT